MVFLFNSYKIVGMTVIYLKSDLLYDAGTITKMYTGLILSHTFFSLSCLFVWGFFCFVLFCFGFFFGYLFWNVSLCNFWIYIVDVKTKFTKCCRIVNFVLTATKKIQIWYFLGVYFFSYMYITKHNQLCFCRSWYISLILLWKV